MVDLLSFMLGASIAFLIGFPLLVWLLSQVYKMGARDYRKRLLKAIDEADGDNEHE